MEKEDVIFLKRLKELAHRSYEKGIFTFTDFLALAEQNLYYTIETELRYAGVTLFGGNFQCDRRVIRFGNPVELGYEEEFPIHCLCIRPVNEKFGEMLSHRDYLGAIMNLGIDRGNIGDIFIKDKTAYVFCLKRIEEFITDNLTKIRHTNVKVFPMEKTVEITANELQKESVLSSSERIDAVISAIYNLSRSQSIVLFRGKKVYLNGRLCENNSYVIKSGDIVSIRGYGKFEYCGVSHSTRKGRLSLNLSIYK